MKNSPRPLHSRYQPRKLLLFLLSNTHPAIGVMGNTYTITLINCTEETMEIRDFRGIYVDENHFFRNTTVNAGEKNDIDVTKCGGEDSHGGELPYLKIFCNGSFLKSTSVNGGDLVLRGERFIDYKTATIEPAAEDQNSTGVVKYKVEFQPQKASDGPYSLTVFSDSVLNHDNGWSVHCNNGSVKLTRKEGMTMTLDPSKLFVQVPIPETSLLNVVLKFWPRTFADLNCKDDLRKTICIVKDLMRQAKLDPVVGSEEAKKVVNNVEDLHNLCAAMVEWYLPLFPQLKNLFPKVADKILAEVNHQKKLERFATTIKDLLR